ncbi:MAG TPA: hypothetical protein PLZ57_02415 [Pseudobdellovibrionaceae bacterium]|nr:hypothetical protein [Pseudobdellovibrionaceae bacterium]
MGKVIPFSEIEFYLTSIEKSNAPKGTILDTNVLISASYDVRDSHAQITEILDILQYKSYRIFATVNTRSEYLEFQRRLILTESLLDLVDEFSIAKLPKNARARIQTLKGSLKTSVAADSEKDEVFNESQLKKIKREFSAGPHSGQKNWLEICDTFLKGKIANEDQSLMDRGVEYISPNDESQKHLFDASLGWPEAIGICEKTGTAFSDSMILNALKASKLTFIVTLDFDVGYAALSDPNMKDVVVPDRLFKETRHYHFPN